MKNSFRNLPHKIIFNIFPIYQNISICCPWNTYWNHRHTQKRRKKKLRRSALNDPYLSYSEKANIIPNKFNSSKEENRGNNYQMFPTQKIKGKKVFYGFFFSLIYCIIVFSASFALYSIESIHRPLIDRQVFSVFFCWW